MTIKNPADKPQSIRESQHDVTRRLSKADTSKVLSGRSAEDTMGAGSSSFVELYGLNRSMKVICNLAPNILGENGIRYSGTTQHGGFMQLSELCLENARARKQIRQELGKGNDDEIDLRVVKNFLSK